MVVVLSANDLTVRYRAFPARPVQALTDVDLGVERGEIVGILGPNGSGKSTLLAVLAGALRRTGGQVRVLGRPPTDPHLVRSVGYQPEGPLPFRHLSARSFLAHLADLMALPRDRRRAEDLLETVGLADVPRHQRVGRFSTGMARRLALAAALLADPEVLLLDEPTAGLDPDGSVLVAEILRRRVAAGGTVLLASHHLEELERLCDRAVVLVDGRVTATGRLDDLLGTDAYELVVADLDSAGLDAVTAAVRDSGGRVLARGRRREHLFALFRRFTTRGNR